VQALLRQHLSEGRVSGREIRRDLDGALQFLLGGGQVPLEKSYLSQGQISLAAVRVNRERSSEFGNGLVFLALGEVGSSQSHVSGGPLGRCTSPPYGLFSLAHRVLGARSARDREQQHKASRCKFPNTRRSRC
jgi:hypothetical protein